MSDLQMVLLIGFFVLTQGFFSGSEIAMVSANRLKLKADAARGSSGAAAAIRLLARPTWALGTCLIGTNISVISVATLMVALVTRHLDVPGAMVTLIAVPLTLTFGEMVPKAIYQQHADRLAPLVAWPLRGLSVLFAPALLTLELLTRLLGGETSGHGVTRQELRLMLEDTHSEDVSDADQQLIRRVFAFTEAVVEEAMLPLISVQALPETATLSEAAALITASGHSRLPIYRERIDEIIGIVIHQDLLSAEDWEAPVTVILRPAIYVPETKPVDELLAQMQREHQRMAVAVDEYGGAVGVITVEDMLEEIVGDIEDESDKAKPLVRQTGAQEWLASARAEREHISDATGLTLPDGDFETVAGFILNVLGKVPEVGESVHLQDYTLTVSRANERAILEVKISHRR